MNIKVKNYLLFLLSSTYKNNYLLFSEKTFIKIKKCFYHDLQVFYKNGKYIIKNKYNKKYYDENKLKLLRNEALSIIYNLSEVDEEYYTTDNNKLNLIKCICDIFKFMYKNIDNGIKII